MTTITTARHPFKFYFVIVMAFLAFMAMGLATGYSFFDKYLSGTLLPKNYPMPVLCLVCIFMAFFTVYRYYQNAPVVTAGKTEIKFNGETISWTDLNKIELTGKCPFRYLFKFPMEGAALHFNDGRTRYIFDDLYANSWQLKSFLQQVVIDKKETAEILTHPVDPAAVRSESFERFKGNQFTSLRGISLWGMMLFFVWLLFSKFTVPPTGLVVFLGGIWIFWFLLHAWLMHYFALSDRYFAVRNHILIWINKVYKIEDIKEVVFETEGRMPNCLRIITKDFRNNRFPAATLRDRTWLLLQEQLEMKGIIVRNECISGGEKINRKPGNDN